MNGACAWTLVDGSFAEGASVPVSDRAFRYGMSVFETFAVRDGKILFLEEHLCALIEACEAAGWKAVNAEAVARLLPLPDGLLRIYVTAGEGTQNTAVGRSRTFAFFETAAFPGADEIARGVCVNGAATTLIPVLEGWKTGNYWANVKALAAARQQGFDETLLINPKGHVISAAMANIFFLIDGTLVTPARREGARPGVVRAWVMQLIPVEEVALPLEKAKEADECFLTNSRLGVMPVAQVSGRRLLSRQVAENLTELYHERVLLR